MLASPSKAGRLTRAMALDCRSQSAEIRASTVTWPLILRWLSCPWPITRALGTARSRFVTRSVVPRASASSRPGPTSWPSQRQASIWK